MLILFGRSRNQSPMLSHFSLNPSFKPDKTFPPVSTSQSLASDSLSFTLPGIFPIQVKTEPILSFRPFRSPEIIKPPCSAMTVDGLWIPNAFLKPSINGSKICCLIQEPIPFTPSTIPLKIPSTTFPPHSSIFFWKYCFASCTFSLITPPKKAARPPKAAPISSKVRSAIPFQSIAARPSQTFSPSWYQSIPSRAVIPKSSRPFKPSENVSPMPAKSTVWIALFTNSDNALPVPIQSKFSIAV